MPTPLELRDASRRFREAAKKEAIPRLKQMLASHALALAHLAEKIERKEADTITARMRQSGFN